MRALLIAFALPILHATMSFPNIACPENSGDASPQSQLAQKTGSAMDDTSDTVTKFSKKNLHPFDHDTQTDFPQFFKNSLKYVRKHLPFPLADGTMSTMPTPKAKKRKKSGAKAASSGAATTAASGTTTRASTSTNTPTAKRAASESQETVLPTFDDAEAPLLIDLVCDSTSQGRSSAPTTSSRATSGCNSTPTTSGATSCVALDSSDNSSSAHFDAVSAPENTSNEDGAHDEAEVSSTTLDGTADAENETSNADGYGGGGGGGSSALISTLPLPAQLEKNNSHDDNIELRNVGSAQRPTEPKLTALPTSHNRSATGDSERIEIPPQLPSQLPPQLPPQHPSQYPSQPEKKTLYFNPVTSKFTHKPNDLVWIGLGSLKPSESPDGNSSSSPAPLPLPPSPPAESVTAKSSAAKSPVATKRNSVNAPAATALSSPVAVDAPLVNESNGKKTACYCRFDEWFENR